MFKKNRKSKKSFSDADIEKYFDNIDHKLRVSSLNTTEMEILEFLKSQKRYDKIYFYFGPKTYRKNAPFAYQVKDITSLLEEGRFYHLYEKYGEKIYYALLPYMTIQDRNNELGTDVVADFVTELDKKIRTTIISLIIAFVLLNTLEDVALIGLLNLGHNDAYKDDAELVEILKEYDESLETYAEYIDGLALSDLEIIVKVMSDMWDSTYGYNENVAGYSNTLDYARLAMYTYGYGVCRHMADDFTARMNAINPEYKAYNMTVYLQDVTDLATITRYSFPATSPTEDASEGILEPIMDNLQSKIGNHMVTCLTIPNTDTQLIVDVTNPAIGVLHNGQVIMLTEDPAPNIIPMHDSNIGYKWKDKDTLFAYLSACIKSYFLTPDIESLKEMYGTVAQNEALKTISQYDSSEFQLNTINTSNDDEEMGKTPLYYCGYTLDDKDGYIYLYPQSKEASSLDAASYHEINNYLKRHADMREIKITTLDGTIDFSKIDFSSIDALERVSIRYDSLGPTDKVIEINGTIENLIVDFAPCDNTPDIGQIAIRVTNTHAISVNLPDDSHASSLSISTNDNAHVIYISGSERIEANIDEFSGRVVTTYCRDGVTVSEEKSYEKHLKKVLP